MLNTFFNVAIVAIASIIVVMNMKRFKRFRNNNNITPEETNEIYEADEVDGGVDGVDGILKLVTDRIAFENSLSIEEYNSLKNNKINWRALSANERVFTLLKNRIKYENNTEDYMKKYGDNRIDWISLSLNRNATELLKERIEYEKGLSKEDYEKLDDNRIDWTYLSGNPSAIDLLRANPEKIDWGTLSQNKYAIDLLKENPEKIVWESLSYNQNAIDMLKENVEKIVWDNDYYYLFEEIFINNLSELIELFKKKIEYEKNINDEKYKKIDWNRLSLTQNTYELLKTYPEKIVWKNLSKNKDPAIIELLKERFEYEKGLSNEEYLKVEYKKKIDWHILTQNNNAIELLKNRAHYENTLSKEEYENLGDNKIFWEYLSDTDYGIELLKEYPDKNCLEIFISKRICN